MFKLFSVYFCWVIFVSHFSVLAKDTITVVTEEWPPYNYTNEQGEFVGLATELLKEVLVEANIDYHIEVLSWSRAYKLAKENSNTLIFTIYNIENRSGDFQWICPFISTHGVSVYVLKNRDDIKVSSLDDAKNYTVGSISSGVVFDLLMQNGFAVGKNLDLATDEIANIRKMFKGRVDIVIQEEEPFKLRVAKSGMAFSDVRKIYTLFSQEESVGCMAMSLDTPATLVEKISKALTVVKKRRQKNTSN